MGIFRSFKFYQDNDLKHKARIIQDGVTQQSIKFFYFHWPKIGGDLCDSL